MKSRSQKRPGKQDLHFLNEDGMVACNPRDREASHRAQVEKIATQIAEDVTCKKCMKILYVQIRKEKLEKNNIELKKS